MESLHLLLFNSKPASDYFLWRVSARTVLEKPNIKFGPNKFIVQSILRSKTNIVPFLLNRRCHNDHSFLQHLVAFMPILQKIQFYVCFIHVSFVREHFVYDPQANKIRNYFLYFGLCMWKLLYPQLLVKIIQPDQVTLLGASLEF